MRLLLFASVHLLLSINQSNVSSQGLIEHGECKVVTIEKEYLNVYAGWPNKILCSLLFHGTDYDIYDFYEYHDLEDTEAITCKIWNDNNDLIYEIDADYDTLDSDERSRVLGFLLPANNTKTNFKITLQFPNRTACFTTNIHLNITQFTNMSCQGFVDSRRYRISLSRTQSSKHLLCQPEQQIFPKLDRTDGITYQWQRNCSAPPNNTDVTDTGVILVKSLDFDHAGIYTCSVTYNGMTRYLALYTVCVAHRHSINKQSVSCSRDIIYSQTGRDAVFTCHVNFGEGNVDQHQINIAWQKWEENSTNEEFNFCDSDSNIESGSTTSKDSISCTFNIVNTCYLHVANDAERQVPEAIVPIKFKISNVQPKDYGYYVIKAETSAKDGSITYQKISLQMNPIPDLLTQAQIAGICIGVLCILLILMGVALYHRIYIRVYYKRYLVAYVVEDTKYGAFFAYQYSEDINQFAQDDVKISVHHLHRIFEELGFQVYDERRDGYNHPNRVENVRMSIERSHRIVILLTLEFIKDGWSMLALQTGFDEMIQSGSKLIFILLPGMKEYLKQHSKNNDTCRMIQRAMKLNYTLEWSNAKKFNMKRFKLEVEDAMPKLKPHPMRSTSTSSNGNISMSDYRNVDFKRCFSNETDITEIDVPRCNGDILRIVEGEPCYTTLTSL